MCVFPTFLWLLLTLFCSSRVSHLTLHFPLNLRLNGIEIDLWGVWGDCNCVNWCHVTWLIFGFTLRYEWNRNRTGYIYCIRTECWVIKNDIGRHRIWTLDMRKHKEVLSSCDSEWEFSLLNMCTISRFWYCPRPSPSTPHALTHQHDS